MMRYGNSCLASLSRMTYSGKESFIRNLIKIILEGNPAIGRELKGSKQR